jgi:aspartyl-tRNA(Asn)/glutamyl-tRNA(Gln) amidotransferase subunit C
MKVSREEVEHVAMLARLRLTEEEKDRLTDQLNSILDHFVKMQELDTEHVQPTSHVIPMQNVSRPDVVGECLTQEQALANAPEQRDSYFVVPRIVET